MKMKFTSLFFALFLFFAIAAQAQLREDLVFEPETYTTSVTHSQGSSSPLGGLMNLLNMSMSHSYSMSFSSFGGQMQNLNAYTNSMFFDISDKFDAQVDLSLLHSPFGNSFMNNQNLGAKFVIDQARLDFTPTENTRISLQFSQRPYYYSGFGPYGYGHDTFYSPYNRRIP